MGRGFGSNKVVNHGVRFFVSGSGNGIGVGSCLGHENISREVLYILGHARGNVLGGKMKTEDVSVLGSNSALALGLPSSTNATSTIPTSVPLSVVCRSSSVLIVGGGPSVTVRRSRGRHYSTLSGTITFRLVGRKGRYMFHSINELSGKASNVIIYTLGGFSTTGLDNGVCGRCLTITNNRFCNSNIVSGPVVEPSPVGALHSININNRETIAR